MRSSMVHILTSSNQSANDHDEYHWRHTTSPRRVDRPHLVFPNCPSVFIRVDRVRLPLLPPYAGPFRVLVCQDKYFVIDISGFKTAYIDNNFIVDSRAHHKYNPGARLCDKFNPPTSILKKTRSGPNISSDKCGSTCPELLTNGWPINWAGSMNIDQDRSSRRFRLNHLTWRSTSTLLPSVCKFH